MTRIGVMAWLIFGSLLLGGCSGVDGDYIPYRLTGLGVWLWDSERDRSIYAGRVETNYFDRAKALVECRDKAVVMARQLRLDQWSYVCCTITPSTDCETKVR